MLKIIHEDKETATAEKLKIIIMQNSNDTLPPQRYQNQFFFISIQ